MPSELLWALAASVVLVAVTGLGSRAFRCGRAISHVLLRVTKRWLYERWDYGSK
jgi:hypothetical protein